MKEWYIALTKLIAKRNKGTKDKNKTKNAHETTNPAYIQFLLNKPHAGNIIIMEEWKREETVE